ncbi:hypothetical protein HGA88_02740 [Candidatus Roizmanbacteria bacterium]|nr:hypothetical protein [Candidatus Roizmanbacteria bacterium]
MSFKEGSPHHSRYHEAMLRRQNPDLRDSNVSPAIHLLTIDEKFQPFEVWEEDPRPKDISIEGANLALYLGGIAIPVKTWLRPIHNAQENRVLWPFKDSESQPILMQDEHEKNIVYAPKVPGKVVQGDLSSQKILSVTMDIGSVLPNKYDRLITATRKYEDELTALGMSGRFVSSQILRMIHQNRATQPSQNGLSENMSKLRLIVETEERIYTSKVDDWMPGNRYATFSRFSPHPLLIKCITASESGNYYEEGLLLGFDKPMDQAKNIKLSFAFEPAQLQVVRVKRSKTRQER